VGISNAKEYETDTNNPLQKRVTRGTGIVTGKNWIPLALQILNQCRDTEMQPSARASKVRAAKPFQILQ